MVTVNSLNSRRKEWSCFFMMMWRSALPNVWSSLVNS
jgi:hypothetical protein